MISLNLLPSIRNIISFLKGKKPVQASHFYQIVLGVHAKRTNVTRCETRPSLVRNSLRNSSFTMGKIFLREVLRSLQPRVRSPESAGRSRESRVGSPQSGIRSPTRTERSRGSLGRLPGGQAPRVPQRATIGDDLPEIKPPGKGKCVSPNHFAAPTTRVYVGARGKVLGCAN